MHAINFRCTSQLSQVRLAYGLESPSFKALILRELELATLQTRGSQQ